jgi:hypothetical protein
MVEGAGNDWITNNSNRVYFMGCNGMVEMVAIVFVTCVFGLLMAYFLGDRFMKKSVFIVLAIFGCITAGLAIGFGLAAFLVYIMMLLWNSCLVGTVAGVGAVGFWQAWGLLILSGLLFKGGWSVVFQQVIEKLKK